jgi:hypothetical protein
MYQKNLVAVILAVAALASITAINMAPSIFAFSNGEPLAPGQFGEGSLNKNPSNDFPSPGNPDQDDYRRFSNPGQCQSFLTGPAFEADKDVAHEMCHGDD